MVATKTNKLFTHGTSTVQSTRTLFGVRDKSLHLVAGREKTSGIYALARMYKWMDTPLNGGTISVLDGGNYQASKLQNTNSAAIQRCIHSLVHSSQCIDATCLLPSCHKMKRLVSHAKECTRTLNGGCPMCKQFVGLCCYHSKLCPDSANCLVPFCQTIKNKLRQQLIGKRLVEAAIPRDSPHESPSTFKESQRKDTQRPCQRNSHEFIWNSHIMSCETQTDVPPKPNVPPSGTLLFLLFGY
jgi:hypothetical protein